MKRFFCYFLIVLSAVSMIACKGKKTERAADEWLSVKAKGTVVPQNIGPGSTLTSCSYKEKVLSYRIETTSDSLAVINVDTLRNNTIRNWKTNLNSQEILKKVLAANAKVKYTYVSGTDSIVMTLDAGAFK